MANDFFVKTMRRAAFLLSMAAFAFNVAAQEQLLPELNREMTLSADLHTQWVLVLAGIKNDNLEQINKAAFALEKLRNEADFDNLEEYSLILADEAQRMLDSNELEKASFYLKKTSQLSPLSPLVAFKTLSLVRATGTGSVMDQIFLGIGELRSHPELVLTFIKCFIYPLLWALTFGLYAAFVIHFSLHIQTVLITVARYFPSRVRGVITPLAAMTVLGVPCIWGPLWCLLAWSVLLLMISSAKRWLCFFTGVVLLLWGIFIPLRENLKVWLADEGIQSVLRIASGSFSVTDKVRIENLVKRRPSDPIVFYTQGQLLRRQGLYDQAEAAFSKAEVLMPGQAWTIAERGVIAFLRGDKQKANSLYEEAERAGLSTPEFYFNYSKIKFDLLETAESRVLFSKASRMNPQLINALKKREDSLGARAVAEIRLPNQIVLMSSLRPTSSLKAVHGKQADVVMNGTTPAKMMGLGLLLILLFGAFGKRQGGVRFQTYYSHYVPNEFLVTVLRFIPGGAWSLAGKPVITFAMISLAIFSLIPLVGWPVESAELFDAVPGIREYYIAVLISIWVAVVYLGAGLENEAT